MRGTEAMIEGYEIKRGLYRLGKASTAQLAAFSGQSDSVVEGFLENRSDLLDDTPTSGASSTWRLSSDGRRIVRNELRKARHSSELDRLKDDCNRVRRSLAVLEEDVELFTATPDALAGYADAFGSRVAATRKAIARLAEAGRAVAEEESRLRSATERFASLERSLHPNEFSDALNGMERSVAEYLRRWTDLWTGRGKFLPEHADAGPLVLVHGPGREHGLVRRMIAAAMVSNSPVIQIALGDRSRLDVLDELDRLGSLLTETAGAAVKIVFVVDGNGSSADWLADRCLSLDAARTVSSRGYRDGTSDASLVPVIQATDKLVRSSGGLSGFVDVFQHRISSTARHVAGALLSLEPFARRVGQKPPLWTRSAPRITWVDTASDRRSERLFRASPISYLGLRDLSDSMLDLLRPLQGAAHGFFRTEQTVWLLVSDYSRFRIEEIEHEDETEIEDSGPILSEEEFIDDDDVLLAEDFDHTVEYDEETGEVVEYVESKISQEF